MPVSTPGQLQDVLLVDRTHVVIVTLQPSLSLLADPAHVVAAVAGPALVSEDGLQDVVAAVVAADVIREAPVLVLSVILGLSLRPLSLSSVLALHFRGLNTGNIDPSDNVLILSEISPDLPTSPRMP